MRLTKDETISLDTPVCDGEGCFTVDTVECTLPEWYDYIFNGLFVQEVWSDRSEADRSKFIGVRSGYYLCNSCFEKLEEDEDE